MKKILLIEDHADMGEMVRLGLTAYDVQQACSLNEAIEALHKTIYDLILIDVSLPDGSGFDLCLALSQDPRHTSIPKILLTGRTEPSDKVYGFNCGASDYITKPFHLLEFRARVDRFLAPRGDPSDSALIYDCFSFNLNFQRCEILCGDNKQDLALTPTEFRLFLALAKSEGKVLSREELERMAWEANGTYIQARGVDTHIAHLRKKLGALGTVIVSVYGQGYAFQSTSSVRKSA
jgi:DNA-binding response OmpR family regulator